MAKSFYMLKYSFDVPAVIVKVVNGKIFNYQ